MHYSFQMKKIFIPRCTVPERVCEVALSGFINIARNIFNAYSSTFNTSGVPCFKLGVASLPMEFRFQTGWVSRGKYHDVKVFPS